MRHERHRRLHPALLAAGYWLLATACLGQDEPLIVGERPVLKKLHFDHPLVALELLGQYTQDSAGSVEARQTRFEELVSMQTAGYILSPAFFDLTLRGSVGAQQSQLSGDVGEDRANGILYTWDARGTFLRGRDASLSLYTDRYRQLINRQFGATLENTTTTYGASLDLRYRSTTNHLEIQRATVQQRGATGFDDFDQTRDTASWFGVATLDPRQTLAWAYTYSNVHQTGFTSADFEAHDATVTHDLAFGPANRHSLRSNASYGQQSGEFDSRNFRLDEELRLRHTERFETHYGYLYDWRSLEAVDQQRHRGRAGFVHRLFESLITTGNAGAQYVTSSAGGDITEYFGNINFDYRKKVPLGLLTANFGADYIHTQTDPRGASIQVLNEPRAFTDSLPIVIAGTGLDPGTLSITDPLLIPYRPGIDYAVTALADRLEIRRVPGGAILPGQSVLLNYRLPPAPSSTTETTSFSTGARYDILRGPLRGLGVYGRYSQSNQDIQSPNPTFFVPNDVQDTLVGVEYRFWHARIGVEREWFDSSIAPYTATRFFARASQRLGPKTAWNADVTYHLIDFSEPPNAVSILTAGASLNHRFSPRLIGSLTALYHHQEDDLAGPSDAFEQQAELRWTYRQTSIYGLVRNSLLRSRDEERDFLVFQVGVRREF